MSKTLFKYIFKVILRQNSWMSQRMWLNAKKKVESEKFQTPLHIKCLLHFEYARCLLHKKYFFHFEYSRSLLQQFYSFTGNTSVKGRQIYTLTYLPIHVYIYIYVHTYAYYCSDNFYAKTGKRCRLRWV